MTENEIKLNDRQLILQKCQSVATCNQIGAYTKNLTNENKSMNLFRLFDIVIKRAFCHWYVTVACLFFFFIWKIKKKNALMLIHARYFWTELLNYERGQRIIEIKQQFKNVKQQMSKWGKTLICALTHTHTNTHTSNWSASNVSM